MKQSSGRLIAARLMSRKLGLGVAAAVVAGITACGGSSKTPCPNLPQATAVVGQSSFSTGTTATVGQATVSGPQGSVASNGTLFYVADTSAHRILGYSSLPTGTGASAGFVVGQPDFTTNTSGTAPASGTAIKLSYPSKVSVDPTGTYLVVADSGNNRVLIWNSLPTNNTTAPNVVLGQNDLTTGVANFPDGSTVSASNLSNPTAAVIANGYLIVVDKGNNRVLIWKGIPTSNNAAATYVLGQPNTTSNNPGIDTFSSTTQSYTLAMRQPSDVWTDGVRLLVTDTGNNRVLFWAGIPNTQNKLADNIIGAAQFGQGYGNPGSGKQKFNSPWGVTSDGSNVFVGDTGNNRVVEFTTYLTIQTNNPSAQYVFGQQDFTHITANDPDQDNQVGDQRNNPATSGITAGTMDSPQGVFAINGQLFVTDSANNRILQIPISAGVDGTDTNLCT